MYSTGEKSIPQSLVISDMNNDEKLDIVVVNSGSGTIFTLLKCDIGAFQSQITYSTGSASTPQSVSVGDFNNDGYIDIIEVDINSEKQEIFLNKCQ